MLKLAIITPIYNEVETIGELYRRLHLVLEKDFSEMSHEIIFIDDGSTDGSEAALDQLHQSDPTVKVIHFSRNFGHHAAITAGLDVASGDYVVMMDSDLQDQPEEIIKLYAKMKEGYDVVYGERTVKKYGLAKTMLAGLFNWFIRRSIRQSIVINSTIFRIMTKDVVMSVRQLREEHRYLIGLIGWVGFRHIGVPINHASRFAGVPKYKIGHSLALAIDCIMAFSDYPLRLITRIGFFFVGGSMIVMIYILIKKIIYHTPILGWTSLITVIFTLGGLQIVMLGILGNYVGRNYIETKHRPLYIVRKNIQ